jgi:hypothetical protein
MDLKPLFVFPRWSNKVVLTVLIIMAVLPMWALPLVGYAFDPVTLNSGYMPTQPVPYSHALHVGELGIDCRFCHNTVEKADFAAIPPTETCMNCHKTILPNSEKLRPVRESYYTGKPIPWVRVHDLPDYVYFNHAAHVNASISCVSCHGNVNHMEVVYQKEPLNMGWCLQCHREPDSHIVPKDQVTNLDWKPNLEKGPYAGMSEKKARATLGKHLKDQYHVNPNTDCVTCHR